MCFKGIQISALFLCISKLAVIPLWYLHTVEVHTGDLNSLAPIENIIFYFYSKGIKKVGINARNCRNVTTKTWLFGLPTFPKS